MRDFFNKVNISPVGFAVFCFFIIILFAVGELIGIRKRREEDIFIKGKRR